MSNTTIDYVDLGLTITFEKTVEDLPGMGIQRIHKSLVNPLILNFIAEHQDVHDIMCYWAFPTETLFYVYENGEFNVYRVFNYN